MFVVMFWGNLVFEVQSIYLHFCRWHWLLLCQSCCRRGSSAAKTSALRAPHIRLLIAPPTATILRAKLENKPVPNSWGKEGSRHVALGWNAQNLGFALVGAKLFCVKICLAKTLDIIINKTKVSSLTVTGELQKAIFPSLQARKMCGIFFPLKSLGTARRSKENSQFLC